MPIYTSKQLQQRIGEKIRVLDSNTRKLFEEIFSLILLGSTYIVSESSGDYIEVADETERKALVYGDTYLAPDGVTEVILTNGKIVGQLSPSPTTIWQVINTVLSSDASWQQISNFGSVTFPDLSIDGNSDINWDNITINRPTLAVKASTVDIQNPATTNDTDYVTPAKAWEQYDAILDLGIEKDVPVPATVKGATGDKKGQESFDSTHIWKCIDDYTDGVADIWAKTPRASDTPVEIIIAIPATSTSPGVKGQRAIDSGNNLVYDCIADNTWVRYSATIVTTFP